MHIFIGGTPAAGKSTLARKVTGKLKDDYQIIGTDEIRDELLSIPKYEKWVNIFWNMDEKEFMTKRSCKERIDVLIQQSEALFPPILKFFEEKRKEHKNIIFEGVSILPHLASKHLNFKGIYVVLEDKNELLKRLQESNRWGDTDELHKLEVDHFVDCTAKYLREECTKFDYKIFNDTNEAEVELIRLLSQV